MHLIELFYEQIQKLSLLFIERKYFSKSLHYDTAPDDVWGMFYKTQYTHNYTNTQNLSVVFKQNEKYFVYNCVFSNQQNGCIDIQKKDSIDFLHSSCLFHDNYNSVFGGSVNFEANSSIVQHRACAFNSTVEIIVGMFSYTTVSPEQNNLNYHIDCSLTHCDSENPTGGVLWAGYGIILLSSSNLSQNNCPEGSGYIFYGNNQLATINYTTIANNAATFSILEHFPSGVSLLLNSNIINNEISKYDAETSIVYSNSKYNLTVESCYFFGNKPRAGNLFRLYKNNEDNIGKLIVKNCHIDKFSKSGNVETSQIKTDEFFVYLVRYLSTYKCDAVPPDSIGFICVKKDLQCYRGFFRGFVSSCASLSLTHIFISLVYIFIK